ncbi:MAG: hypothetical protein DME25_03950 [Verrucomicrobia bacterium]|nr:MAG: hypothetical protein DME25_03950 [Verrucomicrobiota bacterium]
MKSGFQLKSSRLLVVLLAIWPCIVFAAQPTNAPASLDYSAFKIIPDRNIFNTRRSARYTATTSERGPSRRAARTESFALVGTMNYAEQGPLAFFEGSRSEYKKALKPEEAIAGFKLASIQPNAVKLASPTNEIRRVAHLEHARNLRDSRGALHLWFLVKPETRERRSVGGCFGGGPGVRYR